MSHRFVRRQLLSLSAAGLISAMPAWVRATKFHRQRARQLTGIPCYDYQWGSRSRSEISTARAILLEQSLEKIAREIFEDRANMELMMDAARRNQPVLEEVQPLEILPDQPLPGGPPNVLPAPGSNPTTRPLAAITPIRQVSQHHRKHTLHELEAPRADSLVRANSLRVFQMDRARLAIDHCMVSDVAVQLHRQGCWVLSLRADQNPRLPNDVDEQFIYRPRLHLKRNEFHLRLRCYGLSNTIPAPRGLQAGRPLLADFHPVSFWVQRMEPRHLRVACSDRRISGSFDRITRMEVEFFYR